MKLYLFGHEYKYASEQMLLTMLPQERPEYPEGRPSGDRIELRLTRGEKRTTASCRFYEKELCYTGLAHCDNRILADELTTDRYCQRLIKNAMYRAFLKSGRHRPPWGALTGVRPGKIFCRLLSDLGSEDAALHRFCEEYDVTQRRAELCRDASRETMKAAKSLGERDVCLYVGIPFCPTRCAYCSFVSQSVEKSIKLIEPFLQALNKEIRAVAEQISKLKLNVVSIYFGGGTPTTLGAEQLDALCGLIEEELDLTNLREYTVEAGRPDTITIEKLQVLRKHGVDRVSVNPQTMSDSVLEKIGRRHTAADIVETLDKVREVGGFQVNMDLIAGLPGDNPGQFSDTLDKVLALGVENITVHTLSLKKGSRITLEGADLPTGAEVGQMLDTAMEKLTQRGYKPYYLYRQKFMSGGFENVGWCLPGTENLYNICIMEELCSIIAAGGGGSTKLVCPGDGRNIRLMAPKYPLEYINSIEHTCTEKEKISKFYNENVEEDI